MSSHAAVVWRGVKSGNLRWGILVLLFLITVINYLDRQSLSVLAPVIKKDLGISNEGYSHVLMAFMIANGAIQLAFGPFLDRVGTRIGLALAVVVWSIGGALHFLARDAVSLGIFRFILGAGEGGNWPASTKAVAEWFPAKESGFAMGCFNGGTAIGAILAPPLAVLIATNLGWRATFLVTASFDLIWLVFWLKYYYPPQHHPKVRPEERELIQREAVEPSHGVKIASKLPLLGQRNFWGIFLARFITTPVWWFVTYWLPIFLKDQYGFSLLHLGYAPILTRHCSAEA